MKSEFSYSLTIGWRIMAILTILLAVFAVLDAVRGNYGAAAMGGLLFAINTYTTINMHRSAKLLRKLEDGEGIGGA